MKNYERKFDYEIIVTKGQHRIKDLDLVKSDMIRKKIPYAIYNKKEEDKPYYLCRRIMKSDLDLAKVNKRNHYKIPNLKLDIRDWKDGLLVERTTLKRGEYITIKGV